ncbi:MAG: hypothetical protein WC516_05455 [Patescibacteria group bacterium]|jgi:hypothetical protein
MFYIIDYKRIEMIPEECEYYNKLVQEFTFGTYNGKDQFHDMFDVDDDGCISLIRPPLKKEVGWAVIVFLQNLMINQRLRRLEKKVKEILDGRPSNNS